MARQDKKHRHWFSSDNQFLGRKVMNVRACAQRQEHVEVDDTAATKGAVPAGGATPPGNEGKSVWTQTGSSRRVAWHQRLDARTPWGWQGLATKPGSAPVETAAFA